jgi:hypothetical protein
MWKIMVEPDRPHDSIIRRMHFAWWITKDIDPHSEYVILIAFPRQNWFRERASMLRLCVYCLFCLHLRPIMTPHESKHVAFFQNKHCFCNEKQLCLLDYPCYLTCNCGSHNSDNKISVSWDVRPCSLVYIYQLLRQIVRLHIQGRK